VWYFFKKQIRGMIWLLLSLKQAKEWQQSSLLYKSKYLKSFDKRPGINAFPGARPSCIFGRLSLEDSEFEASLG
jgi:hypothetical protein